MIVCMWGQLTHDTIITCNHKPFENLQSHQDLLKAPRSSGFSLAQGDSVKDYLVVTSQSTGGQLFIVTVYGFKAFAY